MNRLVAFLCALVTATAGLSAQSQLTIDTLLPIARVVGARPPYLVVPEFEGYRRPWVFMRTWYDTSNVPREWCIWRFETAQDTVHDTLTVATYPARTLLDANGDGYRDYYDTLLVLGTIAGWQQDTLALDRRHNRLLDSRTVSDLNADGFDDLLLHYAGDSVRIYWGDSVRPLRESSLILNPDQVNHPDDYGFAKNPRIAIVDLMQDKPMLMTTHEIDHNLHDGQRGMYEHWMGWLVSKADIAQRADTIRVDSVRWHYSFWVWEYVAPQPAINRKEGWIGLRYRDWIAIDTTGLVLNEEEAPDTLVLGSSPVMASLLLPLNHPPSLDSTLVLAVADNNVLSVREWLTPEQLIPSETRAYYLVPQTIYATKIENLVMWPDMTGDSIPELGVRRIPSGSPAAREDYCFEIYDIAGNTINSVVMPRDGVPDADVTIRNGRVIWTAATGERMSVRVHDAAGRLLEILSVNAEELRGPGIDLSSRGRGLRLVELTDGAGRIRRTTIVVR